MERGITLENSVLVVAHPDDEMLWFSSVMRRVGKIIVCLLDSQKKPELGSARKASLQRHPLPVVSLEIDESDAFNGADWEHPVLTDYGIAVPRRPEAAEKYRANYQRLLPRLRRELAGCTQVFTHSPWGEYGHEEHIQVHRVVKDLQQELRFRLWHPNYCSEKSFPLMLQHGATLGSERMTLTTERELADQIRKIYQECNCWTWFPDWQGAEHETFMGEDVDAEVGEPKVGMFPLNFMRISRPVQKKQGILRKIFG